MVLTLLLSASLAFADCERPSNDKLQRGAHLASRLRHLDGSGSVIVVAAERSDLACFWQVRFQMKPSEKVYSFYLSPDGEHLIPAIYKVQPDEPDSPDKDARLINDAIAAGHFPERGDASAPVLIAEFADFQCPYCRVMAQSLSAFVTNTKGVRMVFIENPLRFHPWALAAAEAGECLRSVNTSMFWRFHDHIFANQAQMTSESITKYSASLVEEQMPRGAEFLSNCMADPETFEQVSAQLRLSARVGVSGTPTIFINGIHYSGVKSVDELIEIVRNAQKDSSRFDSQSMGNTTSDRR